MSRALWVVLSLAIACGGTDATPVDPVGSGRGPAEADAGPSQEDEAAAAVQKAINEYSAAVHTCWAVGAADDFNLAGRVVLSIDLSPGGGKAKSVAVVEDDTRDKALLSCLVRLWKSYEWPDAFGDIEQLRLPPFELEAPDAQYTVAGDHAAVYKLPDNKSTAHILLDETNTGNAAAAMSMLVIADGLAIPMHRHSSAEILFVLAGGGTIYGLGGMKKGTKVSRGAAIYIPAGTAHGFTHAKGEPLAALQLYTPGGPEQRFKDGLAHGTTPVPEKEQKRPPKKYPRPKVKTSQSVEPLSIAGGKGRVKILWDAASAKDKAAYIGYFEGDAGLSVPAHVHKDSSEYLYMLAGAGELYVEGKAFTVQPGDAIQIPKGIEHSFVVTGEEKVKAIQFYTPSGPEQRFLPRP